MRSKKKFFRPHRRINIESRSKKFCLHTPFYINSTMRIVMSYFSHVLNNICCKYNQQLQKCFSPPCRINIESRSKNFLWNNFLIWLEIGSKNICSDVVAKNKSFTFYVRFLFLSILDYTTVAFVVCIFLFMSQSITELW